MWKKWEMPHLYLIGWLFIGLEWAWVDVIRSCCFSLGLCLILVELSFLFKSMFRPVSQVLICQGLLARDISAVLQLLPVARPIRTWCYRKLPLFTSSHEWFWQSVWISFTLQVIVLNFNNGSTWKLNLLREICAIPQNSWNLNVFYHLLAVHW